MLYFPNSDHVMFSRRFAFRFFIDYAYIREIKHRVYIKKSNVNLYHETKFSIYLSLLHENR